MAMEMQNEATTPVQPRQDPNFVDSRPAHQVIANPIPGYDYSNHPESQAIHNGLAMKRLNTGQPTAGMKIGAPVPPKAQAQPTNVGVMNPYAQQLPTSGHEYSDSDYSKMAVPRGWGHGEISFGGGPATHIFSQPEASGVAQAREAAAHSQSEHAAHTKFLQGIDTDMASLMNEYYAGRASMDQVAGAHAAMSQYAGSLLGNDAQIHTAEAQRQHNFDPRQNPQYMAAMINQMDAESAHHRATAAAQDPLKKLELIDAINGNPQRRQTVLAMQGVDPATIAALPSQPQPGSVNAGNFQQHLAQNPGMAELLGDHNKQMPFDERLTRASQFPDFGDKSSTNRQLFDTWLKTAYGSHPDQWQQMWTSPPEPHENPLANFFDGGAAGLANNFWGTLTGTRLPSGTGAIPFGWRQNYDAAQRRIGILSKYNVTPF
jgi:hypothetical protein